MPWERKNIMRLHEGREALPSLCLRNCTQIGKKKLGGTGYEVNMGSQTYCQGQVEWNLVIEYSGEGGPLKYSVTALSGGDGSWLRLNSTGGVLERPVIPPPPHPPL
jgi:hypothetical protein